MIVVTGASSGIGKEVALLLSGQVDSKNLILVSRRNPEVPSSSWLQCDFTNKSQLQDLVTSIKGLSPKVEFIVHCAGVMRSQSSSSLQLNECIESFMVNTIAPLYLTSSLSKHLAKGRGTAIVISSIASRLDIPGECIYSSSKSALDKGFETLSADLSRLGIVFLKIHPAMINTPMTSDLTSAQKEYMHQQRSSKAEPTAPELAKYILELRDSNPYTTGSSIYYGGIRR
jgi:short-subunit dehydrogenase